MDSTTPLPVLSPLTVEDFGYGNLNGGVEYSTMEPMEANVHSTMGHDGNGLYTDNVTRSFEDVPAHNV